MLGFRVLVGLYLSLRGFFFQLLLIFFYHLGSPFDVFLGVPLDRLFVVYEFVFSTFLFCMVATTWTSLSCFFCELSGGRRIDNFDCLLLFFLGF